MGQCLNQGLTANARIVAVCDVDSIRAQNAKRRVEKFYSNRLDKSSDCQVYEDYQELLDRDDIDGVTISTPDFWHAIIAIAAAKAGKDIHVQKPLTYSLAEGRKLVKAVRSNQRVLQVGSQQRSSETFQHACELARSGFFVLRAHTLIDIHEIGWHVLRHMGAQNIQDRMPPCRRRHAELRFNRTVGQNEGGLTVLFRQLEA